MGDTALEVLTRLSKNGPLTLTALSELNNVAPASMSQSLNRLTGSGYAVRAPDPTDRRKVLFCTTQEGEAVVGAARVQRNAWMDERLAALPPADRAVIARACVLLEGIAGS